MKNKKRSPKPPKPAPYAGARIARDLSKITDEVRQSTTK